MFKHYVDFLSLFNNNMFGGGYDITYKFNETTYNMQLPNEVPILNNDDEILFYIFKDIFNKDRTKLVDNIINDLKLLEKNIPLSLFTTDNKIINIINNYYTYSATINKNTINKQKTIITGMTFIITQKTKYNININITNADKTIRTFDIVNYKNNTTVKNILTENNISIIYDQIRIINFNNNYIYSDDFIILREINNIAITMYETSPYDNIITNLKVIFSNLNIIIISLLTHKTFLNIGNPTDENYKQFIYQLYGESIYNNSIPLHHAYKYNHFNFTDNNIIDNISIPYLFELYNILLNSNINRLYFIITNSNFIDSANNINDILYKLNENVKDMIKTLEVHHNNIINNIKIDESSWNKTTKNYKKCIQEIRDVFGELFKLYCDIIINNEPKNTDILYEYCINVINSVIVKELFTYITDAINNISDKEKEYFDIDKFDKYQLINKYNYITTKIINN